MRRAERVVFAFGALGEAGQAAALAQGPDAVAPAGEDLVRIGLMPHIPDQPVPRRVEHIMQRDRQFDDPEAGPEVPAGDRDRTDRLGAQLVGQLPQGRLWQAAQVVRALDGIQQVGSVNHHPNIFPHGVAGAQP